jgi:hypothetical protein
MSATTAKPLVFLHTGEVHTANFQALVDQLAPGTPTRHWVREDLLRRAETAGSATPEILGEAQDELIRLAGEGKGAGAVLLTCSTIGAAAERAAATSSVPILRVDRPMADEAVRAGRRIAVAACVPTTVAPTIALLEQAAADAGRSIEIEVHLLEEAWPLFLAGDQRAYVEKVAQGLREAAKQSDAVVIAQASMAGAADLCPDAEAPLLSSPRLGVEAALKAWRQATSRDA